MKANSEASHKSFGFKFTYFVAFVASIFKVHNNERLVKNERKNNNYSG